MAFLFWYGAFSTPSRMSRSVLKIWNFTASTPAATAASTSLKAFSSLPLCG